MDWKEKLSKEWHQIDDKKTKPISDKKNIAACKFIAFYALKQGQSEEFLEAQISAIKNYSKISGNPIVEEYIWVDDVYDLGIELNKVLDHCQMIGASLVIAKLEVFSIDIIAKLKGSSVSLVEVDMPEVKNPSDFIFSVIANLAAKKAKKKCEYFIHDAKMKIDFGIVKKYFAERGFGFVGHTFLNTNSNEVFFHIKKIKRSYPDLARILENEDSIEDLYFWYEVEESNKGDQVVSALSSKNILKQYKDYLPVLIEKIEFIWRDINSKTPDWLKRVSVDLMGLDRANELGSKRDALELRRVREKEKNIIEEKATQKVEVANLEKLIHENKVKLGVEDNEFKQLIEEMTPLGFTSSKQVSSYIIRNRLGYKYKNISGVVTMEKDGNIWDYNGGFPPKMYRKICVELGLDNERSNAKAVGFKSFNELYDE